MQESYILEEELFLLPTERAGRSVIDEIVRLLSS